VGEIVCANVTKIWGVGTAREVEALQDVSISVRHGEFLVVIGPSEESWDEAILVEYPSRSAFVSMVTNEAYQQISEHRTAALADSRLIATSKAIPREARSA